VRQAGFAAQLRAALSAVEAPGRLQLAAWELGVEDERVLIAGEDVVPAASTIKVPILLAALEEVASGRLQLGDRLAVPARRVGGSGVLQALPGLASLTLADLLTLMIIVSDNAATNVIIELVGMDRINRFCAEQGLVGTVLRRRMMDAEASRQGLENTTTAVDQAILLDAIAEGALLTERLRAFALQTLTAQQFADALPSLLPDGTEVAHKTGELPGVRHDVGIIAAANGRRAVVAVLVTYPEGGLTLGAEKGLRNSPQAPQSLKVSAGEAIASIGYAAWQALH
jgi:beta-lactamase class A